MSTLYDTIIVGAGLSGLTVAYQLRRQQPQHRLLLLEQRQRVGGVIESHHHHGYICEKGPHGFLDNCPESQDLLQHSGLIQERLTAPLSQYVRYVYLHKQLNCIPQKPGKIILAPLISWPAKLRILAEPFIRPLPPESPVSTWVAHRFGRALLPYVDAVFTGTYAGDMERLSIDAVMPGVRGLEIEHGSVLRGLLAKMRAARGASKPRMPAMTSFASGMRRLPERLAETFLPESELRLGCLVQALCKNGENWMVRSNLGDFIARALVVALPVNAALPLATDLAAPPPCPSIPEAWIKNVVFGFGKGAHLPPGFGYLAPEMEQRFALGSLFSSNMFSDRAPQGHILCETLVGGRRHPERFALDDTELIRRSLADIRDTLGITSEPQYAEVLTPAGGIPQLEQGYAALLHWRQQVTAAHRGLFFCGFGWEGIGLNDMIKTAYRVAAARLENLRDSSNAPAVRKIYF